MNMFTWAADEVDKEQLGNVAPTVRPVWPMLSDKMQGVLNRKNQLIPKAGKYCKLYTKK